MNEEKQKENEKYKKKQKVRYTTKTSPIAFQLGHWYC